MQSGTVVGEATKDHPRQRWRRGQRFSNGLYCNASRTISGETIDAGGNCGVRDRAEAVGLAEMKSTAVAGGEQFILVLMAAMPDWSDGMNHVFGGEPVALRDLCVTGLAAIKSLALVIKLRPGGAMDRAIDATAAEKRCIGGVDDRVNAKRGDIGNDDFEPRGPDLLADQARGQGQAAALTATPLSAKSCCNSPA